MRNLTTQKFGKLTVIKLDHIQRYGPPHPQTKSHWLCRCECGNQKVIRGENLSAGTTISCGCAAKNNARKHGMKGTPEYRAWLSARGRLKSKEPHKIKAYADVTMDSRWDDFTEFFKDLGPKPTTSHELDRIDPYGPYIKTNCRWATRSEQMKNQRRNHVLQKQFVDFNSVVSWSTFRQRVLGLGWTPEMAAKTSRRKNQFG